MMTKPTMSIEDAKRVAAAAAERAATKGWAVVIAILDDGANLLYFERMDGAKLGSIRTAIEKARSSVLFARPTKALEDIIGSGRNAMLRLPEATPIQGGLPLLHDGHLVGGIGVSGVLSPQDEEAARAGAEAL
jgi:glc operon protein GlcG